MSAFEESAKEFLHFGHRYEVLTAFKGLLESFSPGQNFVYTGSATSAYDSAIGYFFYDTATGKTKRYDADWGTEKALQDPLRFTAVLRDLGPDMIYRQVLITGQLTELNWECFNQHVEYLKDYVEGKEGIKSWYVWLEENLPELQTMASRAQLLRLKNNGPVETQNVLNQLQIPYKSSPRYGWT